MTEIEITADILTEAFGAFDELELLGAGSYGTTFRAVRGDRTVAFKVIRHTDMPAYLWDREITSLRAVEHPNVVGFLGAGTVQVQGRELPFLECEYIAGGSVEKHIAAGLAAGEELRQLLTGLLAGIIEIHDLGVIHRDIKPANVGLRDRGWGRPVLLDLGLAKVLDMSTHTAIGQLVGTTRYMAPEQLRGRPARTRSDLFAVGLVVYEAGTGAHPFLDRDQPAATLQGLYDRIADGPPVDPRLAHDWPDDVAQVVLRTLSAEPHERLSPTRALRDLAGS
jgi:eukaryotic-like serine/threonine-protein kinase